MNDTNAQTPPLSPELAAPAPSSKSANRLTIPQTLKLGDWIQRNLEKTKEHPDALCANIAGLELQFHITGANFATCRVALGIDKNEPPKPPTLEEQVQELREKLTALTERVNAWLDGSRVETTNTTPANPEA